MKLKWSLMELQKYKDDILMLDGKIDLTTSLKERKKDLIDVSPILVRGTISVDEADRYYVDLGLETTLILPSTRSLEPVELELKTTFSEVYLAPGVDSDDPETKSELENELVFSLEYDMIDLRKPLEDTILASIPMKILSQEEQETQELPSGQGWEVTLEEDFPEETDESDVSENSPFNILKGLDLSNDKD